jgi:cellulose synthase/poly-beta-1,6-N-acetylglucosamine synthase-like glycosyltransferase
VLNPGLAEIGSPIPLGGTSNHFRTSVLKAIHGWDAWNVTEDADLGT